MKLKTKIVPTILFLLVLIMTTSCSQQKTEWKGTIEEDNGVKIVKNPKEPMYDEAVISLEEDLCIGKENEDEDYMFAEIRSIQVDNEEDIIVLDWKLNLIKVFDKNGKHKTTFGKHGEGPGEIQQPGRMHLKGGKDIGILDYSNNRFSYFSKKGECLKETGLGKYPSLPRAIPDSRGFLYGDVLEREERFKRVLIKFNPDLTPVMTIADMERPLRRREFNPITKRLRYQVMADDRFIWANNFEYTLHIVDPSGKLVRKIIKDYDPAKITEEEKKKIMSDMFGDELLPPGYEIVFPQHYPPIYYFRCDEEGKIYVRTYARNDQGLIKWDVFNEEGHYILSFFHPEEDLIFVIKRDKAYSWGEDNEEGIPTVKRYRMTWK